jgi:solute carrier family 8 (sodium/calcium exchanger)
MSVGNSDLSHIEVSEINNVDDMSYVLDDSELINESVSNDVSMEESLPPHEERKFIVFESCLDKLFKFCPQCGLPTVEIKKFTSGCQLGVKWNCLSNCLEVWHSQPFICSMLASNLLLAGAVLFSGGQFTKFADIASIFKLQIMSNTTFYRLQEMYLMPVVQAEYDKQQISLLAALSNEKVFLVGDGQCDSPGHSAKYLTYTVMHDETEFVLASHVICVHEVANSNAMELEGLKRCLQTVCDYGVNIEGIATDRHPQINSYMDKERQDLVHQFDIFHTAKSLNKELSKASKNKECQDLAPWIQSISNHLW